MTGLVLADTESDRAFLYIGNQWRQGFPGAKGQQEL